MNGNKMFKEILAEKNFIYKKTKIRSASDFPLQCQNQKTILLDNLIRDSKIAVYALIDPIEHLLQSMSNIPIPLTLTYQSKGVFIK